MNTKQTLIAMAVLFMLMGSYIFVMKTYVWPKHPEWFASPTTNPSISDEGNPLPATSGPSTMNSVGASTNPSLGQASVFGARGTADGVSTPLGFAAGQAGDNVGLQISPMGAGLDYVTLNKYYATDTKEPYKFQKPYGGHDDSHPLATTGITVNGQSLDLSHLQWNKEDSSPGSATYGVDIYSGDTALVHLSKTYRIDSAPAKNGGNTADGYEVGLTYHVKNLLGAAQTVKISFDGPNMPPREIERSDDRQVVAGYDTGDKWVAVTRFALGEFKPDVADKDITHNSSGNRFLWAGDSSVYFAAIVRADKPEAIGSVHAVALNPNDLPEDRLVQIKFQTSDLVLDPGSTTDVPLEVFFGPKDRRVLEGDYYADYPRVFKQLLSSSSGFGCGMCAVPWLVDRLVDLLNVFHYVLRDWGLAIITLVLLVRLALHPITKSSQVSMMKMQKMGPELERLKKKHGDDKEAFSKAQVEMYKEMGVAPFLGCLPMFLQMPIWIALYSALQSEIQLRQAPFLWGFTWIHDLARPDRLITWDAHAFTLPILGIKIAAFNILPILMGIVMFVQQRTMRTPAATPEQEQQQKMMTWMSLVFSLFLYNAPSGLNLYILTSTTLGILESKRIRAHIKEKQEGEKDRIIIDAKPTRQGKKAKKDQSAVAVKQGLWGWLQDKVEELRRQQADQEKNKRGGKGKG